MRHAWTIAVKDLRRRIRDRTAILVAVILPFGLAGIFSLTLGDAASGSFTATFAVVDADRSGHLPEEFIRLLDGLDFVSLRTVRSESEAKRLADGGTIDAAVVFPFGFTEAVQAGEGGTIRVTGAPDSTIGSLVALSLTRSFASNLDAVSLSVATASWPDGRPDAAMVSRAQAVPAPATIEGAETNDTAASTSTFFAIGMAVFFLFFAVEFGVRGLLEEREGGTLARLLVAPVRPGAVIAGKAFASLTMGLVSTVLLVGATTLLLDAGWGEPTGVALLVVGGVCAAVGVTSLVATLATTTAQAGAYVSIIAVVGGLLGGTFFPISQAGILGTVRFLSPQGWLMEGFQKLAFGGSVEDIIAPLAAVVVIAFLTSAAAWARARRMVAA